MFQCMISCVAPSGWRGTPQCAQTNLVSFLIFFLIHTRHLCVGVSSFFVGGICTSLWFFNFPSSLPGGSLFGARLGGVGVGVLLESCDSSDDDHDDVDTSLLVCIRFSLTSTKVI
jgi:hypothetical protein